MRTARYISTVVLWLLMAVGCGCYAETSNGELRRIASMSDKAILAEGERMMDNGNEDGALLRFELLIGRAQQDKQLYAKSLHDAGLVYYNRAAYTKAMEYYMKSLDICEQMRLTKETAYLYKDIANVYSMCHDYAQSSRLYKTTLTMARKIGDRSLANNILSNLVFAYQPSTPISQYRAWYNELRSHPDSRPRYPQDVLLVGGTIYGYEKNFTAAINEFRKGVAMAKSRRLPLINLVSAYASLADAFEGNGQLDSAIYYQNLNLKIAEENKIITLKINALQSLSNIYQSIDKARALNYKAEYLQLNDSIFGVNALNEIQSTYFYHEMNKKVSTIDNLSRTNEANMKRISMQQKWIITLVFFTLLFLVLLVIIYRQNRKLDSAYKYLFDKSQRTIFLKQKAVREQRTADKKKITALEKEVEKAAGDDKAVKSAAVTIATGETSMPPTVEAQDKEIPATRDEKVYDDAAQIVVRDDTKISGDRGETYNSDASKDGVAADDKGKAILTDEQKRSLMATLTDLMESREDFCEPDFSIDTLASLADTNTRYVSQVINDVYGENFRTFLNSYRIQKAMERMNDRVNYGNYTIKAIAQSVGYKSQSNFINVFTKTTGLKPSTYMKLLKDQQD